MQRNYPETVRINQQSVNKIREVCVLRCEFKRSSGT
jgi:hypothetical protein